MIIDFVNSYKVLHFEIFLWEWKIFIPLFRKHMNYKFHENVEETLKNI